MQIIVVVMHTLFLSTLSLRRATKIAVHIYLHSHISIHALLAESDLWAWMGDLSYDYFYPRSPWGERLGGLLSSFVKIIFLSTLSLRRATPPAPPRREF